MAPEAHESPFHRLSVFDLKSGDLNVVVDTPKGSRNKFVFDEELGLFRLGGVLPAGPPSRTTPRMIPPRGSRGGRSTRRPP